jgi:hypothetical protein
MPTKSSIVKNYISACSNGELDKLKGLLNAHPYLLGLDVGGGKTGIFYSVRNLKLETTRFLMSEGLHLDGKVVTMFIHYTWNASLESYKFLSEIGTSLYDKNSISDLLPIYRNCCINTHRINKFINLLEYLKKDISIADLIKEYNSKSSNKENLNYKSNMRALKLKLLL